MSRLLPFLFALLLVSSVGPAVVRAGEPAGAGVTLAWQTDYADALARAKRENKHVLLNFTGSDWCGWCHRLDDEVFETAPFVAFAEGNVVLVELDFPRKKALPPALQKQNDSLAEKYDVHAYPTILYLTPEGEVAGRLGYMQGGPKTFIRELKRLAASKKT